MKNIPPPPRRRRHRKSRPVQSRRRLNRRRHRNGCTVTTTFTKSSISSPFFCVGVASFERSPPKKRSLSPTKFHPKKLRPAV